ncbi:efflux RND transporter periplasmic adaptor subunit [Bradyrhizobium sp. S69]|uniref:efflux RND transporter periplasmic adaptor subunit n=1 Tax=Bradyrhizobium sp. S69 TaxID=1641856 RepID=UPI00131A9F08|nr:efflux RND transporter periplasmic adaptor subunit [Bradyrhizobium sp. S69]
MKNVLSRNARIGAGGALIILAVAGAVTLDYRGAGVGTNAASAATAEAAPLAASVAIVTSRDMVSSDEFSGRLEAVERVEIRSRVAGAILGVHFREGELVQQNDLMISIDPSLYAADVAKAEGQVAAANARLVLTKSDFERGQQLTDSHTISQRDFDGRVNAYREADANLKVAEAALQTAKLNLSYTEIRAPVAGRVGKLEITIGNLISAGPGAPVLTTLVSVNPIYVSFNADEHVVTRALKALNDDSAPDDVGRIPVEMRVGGGDGVLLRGKMQLIDNQVDANSGTVRVRAVFDNADGRLIPGQFARVSMGQPKAEPVLLISERAIGTDQNKKFVMVVDHDNRTQYREVVLGGSGSGMRAVTAGLKAGERIVVRGLQKIRPGVPIQPEMVAMCSSDVASAAAAVQR